MFPKFLFGGWCFSPRRGGIFDEISNFKIAVTPRFKVSSKVSRWGSRRRRLRRNKGERSLLVNRICRVVERKEKWYRCRSEYLANGGKEYPRMFRGKSISLTTACYPFFVDFHEVTWQSKLVFKLFNFFLHRL